jgi:Flp pilus assembly protein CpaB
LLAVVVVVVLTTGGGGGATPAGTETAEPGVTGEQTPGAVVGVENMVNIVIAIQDLPRGIKIPEDGVLLQPWPESALPEAGNYFTDVNDVIGRIARTDIFRGSPVLGRQVVDSLQDLAATGSDAAAILPDGRQGISVPLDPSGVGQVAYAIQDGDYVDVILSFLFIDVDETFQTRLPNNISVITRLETGELSIGAPRQGRQEPSTLSPEGVLVGPSEPSQRPRLVTQYVVKNAFVVHVGYFPEGGNFIGATPTPMEVAPPPPVPGEATPQGQVATPELTSTPFTPLIITLGVTPQEALILTYAVDAQLPITLALRQAGDRSVVDTDPVTLQYMIQNFNVAQPTTLPFALEPPITSVRRFDIGTLFDFLGAQVAPSSATSGGQ